jgi:hypothetical protein
MLKLLVQLDSSRQPSLFDRVVGYDGGADDVLSYGGVVVEDVREIVHGAIFTRGPKNLLNTAIFIGGTDVTAGERILAAVQREMFGGFRVSTMLDSNGSNTTATAAVARVLVHAGDITGQTVVVTGGTGSVGTRVAGLFARAGAMVVITARTTEHGERAVEAIAQRFGEHVRMVLGGSREAARALDEASVLINAGPAGVQLVRAAEWSGRRVRVAADLNAVPPLGIEDIQVSDDATPRNGATVFGALGIGSFKMKVHRACITRLFERNDLVLDAEAIGDVARELR